KQIHAPPAPKGLAPPPAHPYPCGMVLEFTKMNGAGNDFVLIDGRTHAVKLTVEQVVRLCDRHRGIGADGLVVLKPCPSGKADWAWEFYNRDGSTGEMCGNAARCFARYVQRQTGSTAAFTFQTEAGIITARCQGRRATVSLTPPEGLRLNERVPLSLDSPTIHSLNTGVPHAVLFVPDADQAMVLELGPEIRRHPHFGPRGTNVNFVQVLGPSRIRVRTFERGVEGETLACGTGVTASALVSSRVHGFRSPVKVRVQGGDELEVSFKIADGQFTGVRLAGPAEFVFEGKIEPGQFK
ncbi:MAG TPA: diaminopimelate epimerase, partial [Dongiaceae bacterium]|nr:diaminopimelate epimerase [Dongiaceae bacterium]